MCNETSPGYLDACINELRLNFNQMMKKIADTLPIDDEQDKMALLFTTGATDDYRQLRKNFKDILKAFYFDKYEYIFKLNNEYAFYPQHADYLLRLFNEYTTPTFRNMRKRLYGEIEIKDLLDLIHNFREFVSYYVTGENEAAYSCWTIELYKATNHIILAEDVFSDFCNYMNTNILERLSDDTTSLDLADKIAVIDYIYDRLHTLETEIYSIIDNMETLKLEQLMDNALADTPNTTENGERIGLNEQQKLQMLDEYLAQQAVETDEYTAVIKEKQELLRKKPIDIQTKIKEINMRLQEVNRQARKNILIDMLMNSKKCTSGASAEVEAGRIQSKMIAQREFKSYRQVSGNALLSMALDEIKNTLA